MYSLTPDSGINSQQEKSRLGQNHLFGWGLLNTLNPPDIVFCTEFGFGHVRGRSGIDAMVMVWGGEGRGGGVQRVGGLGPSGLLQDC